MVARIRGVRREWPGPLALPRRSRGLGWPRTPLTSRATPPPGPVIPVSLAPGRPNPARLHCPEAPSAHRRRGARGSAADLFAGRAGEAAAEPASSSHRESGWAGRRPAARRPARPAAPGRWRSAAGARAWEGHPGADAWACVPRCRERAAVAGLIAPRGPCCRSLACRPSRRVQSAPKFPYISGTHCDNAFNRNRTSRQNLA
jgi:hypothetical protein